jgi:hypothetical protein
MFTIGKADVPHGQTNYRDESIGNQYPRYSVNQRTTIDPMTFSQ